MIRSLEDEKRENFYRFMVGTCKAIPNKIYSELTVFISRDSSIYNMICVNERIEEVMNEAGC